MNEQIAAYKVEGRGQHARDSADVLVFVGYNCLVRQQVGFRMPTHYTTCVIDNRINSLPWFVQLPTKGQRNFAIPSNVGLVFIDQWLTIRFQQHFFNEQLGFNSVIPPLRVIAAKPPVHPSIDLPVQYLPVMLAFVHKIVPARTVIDLHYNIAAQQFVGNVFCSIARPQSFRHVHFRTQFLRQMFCKQLVTGERKQRIAVKYLSSGIFFIGCRWKGRIRPISNFAPEVHHLSGIGEIAIDAHQH